MCLFVDEQRRQALGEGEHAEDRELGQRSGAYLAGPGELDSIPFLDVQARLACLNALASRGGMDPTQLLAGAYGIGQRCPRVTRYAEHHLSICEECPPAFVLRGSPVKRLDSSMVPGEAQRREQVWLVTHLQPVIDRRNARDKTSLEWRRDRDDHAATRHAVSLFLADGPRR